MSDDEQIAYLEELITKYPIDSIEDGLDENGWKITASEVVHGRIDLMYAECVK